MIDVLAPAEAIHAAPELAAVYLSAFGAPGYDEEPARAEGRHRTDPAALQRDDFKLVVSRDAGKLTGSAYGFTGHRGQWWSDRVAAAVSLSSRTRVDRRSLRRVELAAVVEAQGGLGADDGRADDRPAEP